MKSHNRRLDKKKEKVFIQYLYFFTSQVMRHESLQIQFSLICLDM